jgi:hypothetical protein
MVEPSTNLSSCMQRSRCRKNGLLQRIRPRSAWRFVCTCYISVLPARQHIQTGRLCGTPHGSVSSAHGHELELSRDSRDLLFWSAVDSLSGRCLTDITRWHVDIALIEWPERLGPAVPMDHLHVTIAINDGGSRTLTFAPSVERWSKKLEEAFS